MFSQVNLVDNLQDNRRGLFQLFLKHNRSLKNVSVAVDKERRSVKRTTNKYVWLKRRLGFCWRVAPRAL